MFKTYLDESFDTQNGYTVIGGHYGGRTAWESFINSWTLALGKRTRLHMNELRWKKARERRMLERLGPIPAQSGLKRVIGGVNIRDYEDLQRPDHQKIFSGYMCSLYVAVTSILLKLPPSETLEVVCEDQKEYRNLALEVLALISEISDERLRTPDGRQKLAKWSFVPKDDCLLFDQADFTAYARLQKLRDPNSIKSKWCSTILQGKGVGWILNKDEIRSVISAGVVPKFDTLGA